MTGSPFRRGFLFGAVSLLVSQGLLVVIAAVVWLAWFTDDLAQPKATRRQTQGVVTQVGARLCIDGGAGAGSTATEWCAFADDGVAVGVEVGDAITGQVVDIESDPGSGTMWSIWESVEVTAR